MVELMGRRPTALEFALFEQALSEIMKPEEDDPTEALTED